MVASLILAGLGSDRYLKKRGLAKSTNRAALTEHLIVLTVVLVDMMNSTTTKWKETNINSGVVW